MMYRPFAVTDPEIPWDLTRPQAGEAALRTMHDTLARDASPNNVRSANVLTQIARAEALQGKLTDAERTLDRAAKLLGSINDVQPKLRLLLERGRLFALHSRPTQARTCFLEVWKAARETGETFHAIDAAQMMSIVETPKERNRWTLLALELAEQSPDDRVKRWRGDLHITLGKHYEELLQLPKAIECFERAASCFQEHGAPAAAAVARSLIGRVFRLLKRTEEALEIQKSVLAEQTRSGGVDGIVLEELAECSLALKRAEEAENYFKRAYDVVSKDEWFVSNESSRLKRMKTYGKVKASQS
jgi:hypothetical protein